MDLLVIIRNKIKAALDERAAAEAKLAESTAAAVAEARDLNDEENEARNAARSDIERIDAELEGLKVREAEEVAAAEKRAAAADTAKRLNEIPADDTPARSPQAVVRREAPVYHEKGEHSFFLDAYRSQFGYDPAANERLQRNAAQVGELRDVGTSAFGALVVPQYLTDLFAPNLVAGRAFSNTVRTLPLPPEGTSFPIPRGTTATGVAVQSAEGDAVQETDFDETTLTVSLRTYAGQQDVSRQALDRGRGIDSVIYADLAAQYATTLNTANITATLATSGIGSVTYTDASPTVAELFPKLADAVQRINSNRYMPATAIFMHPRRWGWMTAALDANSRPLISTDVPDNTIGLGKAAEYGQVVGQVLGVPVITDACIPITNGGSNNEDIIFAAKADDILLFEDDVAPRQFSFEQTQGDKLLVKLVVAGYSAFTAGRYPTAVAKISGTGLATPSF